MDEFIRRYLLLGLRLGRLVDGIVDAYYGPPELAKLVESEQLTRPRELATEAATLRDQAAREFEDAQRAKFLAAQLDGVAATAERLAGETVSFKDEVRRCYGIEIQHTTEDRFAEVHDELDRLIPGDGDLRERYQAWRRATEIPATALLETLPALEAELRRRAEGAFGLVEGESVEVELVSNEPWSGFNYYLGELKSRIAINTDIPMPSEFLPILLSHEIYPGHHTEHTWKEALLVRGRGQLEETIFLIGTPQCLIAEGIAGFALEALGPEAEDVCAKLLANAGHAYDVELWREVRKVQHTLAAAGDNAAIMLHEQGAGRETARRYLRRWSLETDERLEKGLDFGLHPVWRAYSPIYEAGYRAVAAWTKGEPARFRRLLTEQLTPADIIT